MFREQRDDSRCGKCGSEIAELAVVSLGRDNGRSICDESYPVYHHSNTSITNNHGTINNYISETSQLKFFFH